jgi:hypothetical protein
LNLQIWALCLGLAFSHLLFSDFWAHVTLAAYTNMRQFRLTLLGGEAIGRWATAEYIKTGLGNPLRSKGYKLCQFNFRRRYVTATDESGEERLLAVPSTAVDAIIEPIRWTGEETIDTVRSSLAQKLDAKFECDRKRQKKWGPGTTGITDATAKPTSNDGL